MLKTTLNSMPQKKVSEVINLAVLLRTVPQKICNPLVLSLFDRGMLDVKNNPAHADAVVRALLENNYVEGSTRVTRYVTAINIETERDNPKGVKKVYDRWIQDLEKLQKHEKIAEIYTSLGDAAGAIKHYRLAGDLIKASDTAKKNGDIKLSEQLLDENVAKLKESGKFLEAGALQRSRGKNLEAFRLFHDAEREDLQAEIYPLIVEKATDRPLHDSHAPMTVHILQKIYTNRLRAAGQFGKAGRFEADKGNLHDAIEDMVRAARLSSPYIESSTKYDGWLAEAAELCKRTGNTARAAELSRESIIRMVEYKSNENRANLKKLMHSGKHAEAARIAEELNYPRIAARLYMRASEFGQAGRIMSGLGSFNEATQLFIINGMFNEAAKAASDAGNAEYSLELYLLSGALRG